MKCGGLGDTRDVTDDIKAYCVEVKNELEEKVGRKFEMYEPVKYTSQVVAGTNYFVKIQVSNDGDCVHVRLFQPLPCNPLEGNRNVLFHGHQLDLKMDHPIESFNQN